MCVCVQCSHCYHDDRVRVVEVRMTMCALYVHHDDDDDDDDDECVVCVHSCWS